MIKKRLTVILLAFALLVFFFMPRAALADNIELEELMELVPATSNERESYEEYPADWDFVLIDTRSQEDYQEAHINGAINIPADQIAPCPLPEDMETKLILYGEQAAEAGIMAEAFGFTNVYLFEAGIDAWREAGNYLTTTPEYVYSLIDGDCVGGEETVPFRIIDTRGFGMYYESHLPTAVNMEHTIFESKYLDYMSRGEDMLFITYCGGFF